MIPARTDSIGEYENMGFGLFMRSPAVAPTAQHQRCTRKGKDARGRRSTAAAARFAAHRDKRQNNNSSSEKKCEITHSFYTMEYHHNN